MPPKGEFEICYLGIDNAGRRVPCAGIDYSRPHTTLDPNALAPGTINTQTLNGYLTSSPIVGSSPYATALAAGEYVIGMFSLFETSSFPGSIINASQVLVVTNKKVYTSQQVAYAAPLLAGHLNVQHTWAAGEINNLGMVPGNTVSFVEINGTVYFSGTMLTGIFSLNFTGITLVFAQATGFVAAAYLAELGGRMIAGNCIFPTGGGPASGTQATIAWSGVGAYAGSGASDPWNPANSLGGGFNVLADVPDAITGLASIGRSAFIFRNNGITQQDPGPSGIQPFVWYHLWASPTGVGAFAGTVAQFGQQVIFRSDDNIYSISLTGGVQPIGNQIISKITADYTLYSSLNEWTNAATPWYLASIVNISGELHYILTFSAAVAAKNTTNLLKNVAQIYDLNLVDGAWHVQDYLQYVQATTPFTNNAGFFAFSTPVIEAIDAPVPSVKYYLFGAFQQFGAQFSASFNGILFQLIPLNFDVTSNPYGDYLQNLYPFFALPLTTITFRGEVISLGHRITVRRLRIQASNAPALQLPGATTAVQQAKVTLTGDNGLPASSPPIAMQGNNTYTGSSIQTYYGDVTNTSEMIQASLLNLANPNATTGQCLFRLATVSIIGIDSEEAKQ